MPVYTSGDKWTERLVKNGNSYYLLISEDMKKYLEIENAEEVLVGVIADKKSKGSFIAFYKK